MTVNPAAAQGLGACSPGADRPRYQRPGHLSGILAVRRVDPAHAALADSTNSPKASSYVAKQTNNPFHSFLSL
jgi:hypothetical protein